MSAIPPNCDSYFIFHGTGTSSALPLLPCITSADNVKDIECGTCRACVDDTQHEGWKNIRGNTGGIWRKKDKNGVWKYVLIGRCTTLLSNVLVELIRRPVSQEHYHRRRKDLPTECECLSHRTMSILLCGTDMNLRTGSTDIHGTPDPNGRRRHPHARSCGRYRWTGSVCVFFILILLS